MLPRLASYPCALETFMPLSDHDYREQPACLASLRVSSVLMCIGSSQELRSITLPKPIFLGNIRILRDIGSYSVISHIMQTLCNITLSY